MKLNKDIHLFTGYVIHPKTKKKFSLKDLDLFLQTGCYFNKKPTKKQLKEIFFDPKRERVSKITFTLVDKRTKDKKK